MKFFGTIAFALVLAGPIGQVAQAFQSNENDVTEARVASEHLSRGERFELKGKVFLARLLRADIRWRQSLTDKVGLDHHAGISTIALGAATAAAIDLAGIGAYAAINDARFGQLDREVSYALKEAEGYDAQMKALSAELDNLRPQLAVDAASESTMAGESRGDVFGEPTPKQRISDLEERIDTAKLNADRNRLKPAKLRKDAGLWRKLGRPSRLVLRNLVVAVTVYETLGTIYQISYDPQNVDQIERDLTNFIDDASVTFNNH